MPFDVRDSSGSEVHPGIAITPILLALGPGLFRVVGTGFYITRYGLFVTAKHVVDDLANEGRTRLQPSYTMQFTPGNTFHLRRILSASFHPGAPVERPDIAVCQADNGLATEPAGAEINERIGLTLVVPEPGLPVGTYAYPDNRELDMRPPNEKVVIKADFFEGSFIGRRDATSHPYIRYPHFETTVELRGKASGGPVFGEAGHAFAVNCRGWDFRGGEHEGRHLSYVVSVEGFLDLPIAVPQIPPWSAEYAAIPPTRRDTRLTGRELVEYGHVALHSNT